MLTVDDYARIRRAYRDGMTLRAIARKFGHSWRKVRQAVDEAEPKPYTHREPPKAPKLGRFKPRIEEILKDDEHQPRKQRHTAMQIFRRLAKEGYTGGYDQVRRYVAKKRRSRRETFIPLTHDPGRRVEVDFGHIYVDFPDGRRRVPVLLLTWAYSYCPFVMALPTERTEAILHGMQAAFEFFGCVPREVWWDNPKTVATQILKGRRRKLHDRYAAFASHYNFEPLFCMPARGNEKPRVENRVKDLQRRWATPVPVANDFDQLNAYLLRCCEDDHNRMASGQSESIGCRFERDHQAAIALPKHRFDACVPQEAKADKYQTVAFDRNRYSVPRRFAFTTVTVKGYVDSIEIVAQGVAVARHARSYGSGEQILDPRHFLAVLGRKPACLDHCDVFRGWQLPPAFDEIRRRLEDRHGEPAGARQYIRVLQLLADHSLERVQRILVQCRGEERLDADWIIRRVQRLQASESPPAIDLPGRPAVAAVEVPPPTLDHFNQLLSTHVTDTSGDQDDVPNDDPTAAAVEIESQAVATADHAVRVREARPGGVRGERELRAVSPPLDRIGSCHAAIERPEVPHQAGELPGPQGFRYVRLLCHAGLTETEGVGAFAR
jgi:transposase